MIKRNRMAVKLIIFLFILIHVEWFIIGFLYSIMKEEYEKLKLNSKSIMWNKCISFTATMILYFIGFLRNSMPIINITFIWNLTSRIFCILTIFFLFKDDNKNIKMLRDINFYYFLPLLAVFWYFTYREAFKIFQAKRQLGFNPDIYLAYRYREYVIGVFVPSLILHFDAMLYSVSGKNKALLFAFILYYIVVAYDFSLPKERKHIVLRVVRRSFIVFLNIVLSFFWYKPKLWWLGM